MRLCFNIDLPQKDIRVGQFGNVAGRSMEGYDGRENRRFLPIVQALEALTQINEWQIRRFALNGHPLPLLYDSGVFYKAEPPDEEEWLDIPTLYKQGFGDCEDLAAARCAEYRQLFNIPATPAIRAREFLKNGKKLSVIHCLVLMPDGTTEDPSKLLGMPGEDGQ